MTPMSDGPVGALEVSLRELREVIASLDDSQMDTVTNCEPWTVRQLASHALNNQLLWAGLVTGQALVSVEDTMGAVPIEGDLVPIADDTTARALALWRTEGVLDQVHATAAGDLPGTVVILFATIDAFAHAWDLSTSVGRRYEFREGTEQTIEAIIDATADGALALGLIKPATDIPADATVSEKLMARIGRTIPR